MTRATPLISILIPAYNSSAWIEATLESALAQTYPAIEVIVVNDGSKDDTHAKARAFASRGVRVFDQPNGGASSARNLALREARGEFIQFLDADDLLAPDKIEHQMRLFSARPELQLVSGAWARFHEDWRSAGFHPQPNWGDLTGVEFLQIHYEGGWMMHPAAWLARRTLLDQAGPWDETLSLNDDGEYFARVMLAAGQLGFCNEARSYYRSGLPGSLSGRADRRSLQSLFRSTDLTVKHLLAVDHSRRTLAAVAFAWKWTAFEMYPTAPELARDAEKRSRTLGGSSRPFPAGRRFQLAARVLGWRLAKRFFHHR